MASDVLPPSEFDDLSIEEKNDANAIAVPDWHRDVVDGRLKDAQDDLLALGRPAPRAHRARHRRVGGRSAHESGRRPTAARHAPSGSQRSSLQLFAGGTHLNKRSLYAAIGQATSRLQRPLPLSQAIHWLMVLDAIVEDPEMVWLGTADDKAAHLTALTSITPEELPHVTSGTGERRTVRYFPDRLPIGIHLAGRGVLVYIVLDPTLNDFRLFLERHAAVLRALRAWTVRVVIPMQPQVIEDLAQKVSVMMRTSANVRRLKNPAVSS